MGNAVLIHGKNIKSFTKSVLVGAVIGISLAAITFLISAFIFSKVSAPLGIIPYVAIACVLFGSFMGGYFAGKINGEKGIIMGLIVAAIFVIIILIISLVTNNIMFDMITSVKLISIVVAGIIGGIIGVNKKNAQF